MQFGNAVSDSMIHFIVGKVHITVSATFCFKIYRLAINYTILVI